MGRGAWSSVVPSAVIMRSANIQILISTFHCFCGHFSHGRSGRLAPGNSGCCRSEIFILLRFIMIMIFFLFSFIYKEAPSALQRTRWEFREWDIMYTHRNISIFVSWISSHHFFYVRLFALVFIVVFLFISSQSIQLHFPIKSCPCCLTAFFLPNAVSAVGPQNTIGHPTQRHEGFKQVPVVSAYGIQ